MSWFLHFVVLLQMQLRMFLRSPLQTLVRLLLPAAILLAVRFTVLTPPTANPSAPSPSGTDLPPLPFAGPLANAVPTLSENGPTLAFARSNRSTLVQNTVAELMSMFSPPLKASDVLEFATYAEMRASLDNNSQTIQVTLSEPQTEQCASAYAQSLSNAHADKCNTILLQVRSPVDDPVSGLVVQRTAMWPWHRLSYFASMRALGVNVSAVPNKFEFVDLGLDLVDYDDDDHRYPWTTSGYTVTATATTNSSSEGGVPYVADDWASTTMAILAVTFVTAFFAFTLAAHSHATFERRAQLDVSLRVSGVSFGALTAARIVSEGALALLSAGLFCLAGFLSKIVLFEVAPEVAVSAAFLVALNMTVYGFALAQLVYNVEVASSLLFSTFLCAIGLAALIALSGVDTWFGFGLSWWSACGFSQNVTALFLAVAQYVQLSAQAQFKAGVVKPAASFPVDALSLMSVSGFSAADHIGFLALDVVLAWLFTWWLGNAFPGDMGIPKSCCFCISPLYLYKRRKATQRSSAIDVAAHAHSGDSVVESLDADILGEIRSATGALRQPNPPPLVLLKLSKLFKKGRLGSRQDVRALDNVTLLGENGCIALVGHNGAGKSTLVSMLVGLQAPSFGDAFIFGKSLTAQPETAGIIGLCPQQNIVWPFLTVAENVRLYTRLKWPLLKHRQERAADDMAGAADGDIPGCADTVEGEVTRVLHIVNLLDRRDSYARELSGGMQRRLTFALSLVCDPPIVVLDEPCCGLDPRTKHRIHTAIEKLRKNHLLLLCTHDMDEASSLADKVALLALGQLRACGHVLALKKRFGVGFRVSITTDGSADVAGVIANLRAALPALDGAAAIRAAALSVVLTFPPSAVSDLLATMALLEARVAGVQQWALSQCTLEDLFIKLTHGSDEVMAQSVEAGPFTLTYARASDEEVLGAIELQRQDTLPILRARLQVLLRGEAFSFLDKNGAAISHSSEYDRFCVEFLPCISLAFGVASGDELEALRRDNEAKQLRIVALEAEIQRLQQLIGVAGNTRGGGDDDDSDNGDKK
jgi:ABC-type multidrug transport system ATPase subunit